MIIIDADSHFTTKIRTQRGFGANSDADRFLSSGQISFGHWKIGGRHNAFVLHLHNLPPDKKGAIFLSMQNSWRRCFKKELPTILIYPAESTAFHIASEVAQHFAIGNRLVVASPAFRESDRFELRLEINGEIEQIIKSANRSDLNVIFFDDSFSSGFTETQSIAALETAFAALDVCPRVIRWLTFPVLFRGNDIGGFRNQIDRVFNSASSSCVVHVHRDAYTTLHMRSHSESYCSLCKAHRKISDILRRAPPFRESTHSELRPAAEIVSPKQTERHKFTNCSVNHEIAKHALALTNIGLSCASESIHFHLRNQDNGIPKNYYLGALLYVSTNFDDICAYLSREDILFLIDTVTDSLSGSDSDMRTAFCVSLFALPIGYTYTIIPSLAVKLLKHDLIDLAAIVAMVAVYSHDAAADIPHENADLFRGSLRFLKERYEFVKRIENSVRDDANIEDDIREVFLADLSSLKSGSTAHSVVSRARTLCALLHRGRHDSFLSRKVEKICKENLGDVKNGLAQVLTIMKELPPCMVNHMHDAIGVVQDKLSRATASDEIGELALIVLDRFWNDEIDCKFFLGCSSILTFVKSARSSALSNFSCFSPNVDIYDQTGEFCPYVGIAPVRRSMISHFRNLVENPYSHINDNSKDGILRHPAVSVYLTVDNFENFFVVAVCDSGHPVSANIWNQPGGLSNMKANLGMLGGDVMFLKRAEIGEEPVKCAWGVVSLKFDWKDEFGSDCNVFLTLIPIVRKTPTYETQP